MANYHTSFMFARIFANNGCDRKSATLLSKSTVAIWDYLGLSGPIWDYSGLFGIIWAYNGGQYNGGQYNGGQYNGGQAVQLTVSDTQQTAAGWWKVTGTGSATIDGRPDQRIKWQTRQEWQADRHNWHAQEVQINRIIVAR